MHRTLKMTPALAAGILDRLYDVNDIAAFIDAGECAPKNRGPCKKKVACRES